METRVSSGTREALITDEGPTVLIGERINPSGKKKLADALKSGDFDVVRGEAIAQVEAGGICIRGKRPCGPKRSAEGLRGKADCEFSDRRREFLEYDITPGQGVWYSGDWFDD